MLTLSEADFVALTLWAEARGEAVEGRIAVGCVLRNRLRDGRWGASYERVCLAPQQFSCWNAGPDANHSALVALRMQVQAGTPIADAMLRECYWIASGVMAQAVGDRVDRATHYYASSLAMPPAWARTGHLVATVGAHFFFAGVP